MPILFVHRQFSLHIGGFVIQTIKFALPYVQIFLVIAGYTQALNLPWVDLMLHIHPHSGNSIEQVPVLFVMSGKCKHWQGTPDLQLLAIIYK